MEALEVRRVRGARRLIRRKESRVGMVIGEDLGVDLVMDFASKHLMGKFGGKQIVEDTLNVWMQKVWGKLLVMVLHFTSCHKGGLAFFFAQRQMPIKSLEVVCFRVLLFYIEALACLFQSKEIHCY